MIHAGDELGAVIVSASSSVHAVAPASRKSVRSVPGRCDRALTAFWPAIAAAATARVAAEFEGAGRRSSPR